VGRGGERPPPGAAKIRHASIARPFAKVGRSTLSRATDRWSSGPRGSGSPAASRRLPPGSAEGKRCPRVASVERFRRGPNTSGHTGRTATLDMSATRPVQSRLADRRGRRYRVQAVSEPLGGDYHGAARVASVAPIRRVSAPSHHRSAQGRRREVRTRMRSTLRKDSRLVCSHRLSGAGDQRCQPVAID
jgi:hypothetical protein